MATKQTAEHIGKISIICFLNDMTLKVDDSSIKVTMKFNHGLTCSKAVSYSEKYISGYTVQCVEELATRYSNGESFEEIATAISNFDPF